MSLNAIEQECEANAKAPRVSLADIEAQIAAVFHITGDTAIGDAPTMPELKLLSLCLIVTRNGFTIVGKSAPCSAANFNADLGRRLAYDDAVRQIWPLEGYVLRNRLQKEKAL